MTPRTFLVRRSVTAALREVLISISALAQVGVAVDPEQFERGLRNLWAGEEVTLETATPAAPGDHLLRSRLLSLSTGDGASSGFRLSLESTEYELRSLMIGDGASSRGEVLALANGLAAQAVVRLDELDVRLAGSVAGFDDVERVVVSQVDRLFEFFDRVDLGASGNRDRLDVLLAEFAAEVEAFGVVDVTDDGLVAAWPSEFEPLAEWVDRLAGLVPELGGVGEAEVARLRVVGLGRFVALLASDSTRGEFWARYHDAVAVWLGSPDSKVTVPELEEFRPDDPQDHWTAERAVFDVAVAESDRSVFDRVYLLSVAGIGDWLVSVAPTPRSVDGVEVYDRCWSAVEGLLRDLVLADLASGARAEPGDVEVLGRLLSTVRVLTGRDVDEMVAGFAAAVGEARASLSPLE